MWKVDEQKKENCNWLKVSVDTSTLIYVNKEGEVLGRVFAEEAEDDGSLVDMYGAYSYRSHRSKVFIVKERAMEFVEREVR